MAKFTINIIADNRDALEKVAAVERRLNDIGRNPIEIKIDAVGDVEVLKLQTKLEQARASALRANAKIVESENKVKIARAQTRTVTAQTVLEEKKAETAKKQATVETKKAARVEKERQTAIERSNTALQQKALQEERTKTKTAELALQEEKTKTATERRATAEANATNKTKQLGTATKATESATKSLTNTLQQYIQWYLRWTLTSGAFKAAIGSVRDALETMKAVDDELVTVRKVTGFAADDMKRIEEQAYKTASAYGVAANEYLESVAAFARAGYKEQSDALAELSTKTQIVGDTTAEVANQFLLSVDAAYKYGGSIEELSKVLDGANEIDNKYATSIEKIASGMGIVAPVAAQMHVTIDELAASIGTITAVTQRSGTEAARALRALFLNIAGDTKTEIDEGVTWTTGEIEGLRDVIKQFSKDAYDAAQATGSIINPMKAMEGLAKSMQEGVLTEQKLIEMVSDIGGKLRTSQLLAIIQNWDMYQSMLKDYAGAIGSADREVENALDSWSRKTEQLKNAWTEFISHLIETKQIKGAIDILTGAVNLLDSAFGKAAVTAGLLFAAMKVTGVINGLIALISGLITTIGGLTTATELFNVVWAASPFMVVAIGVAALYAFGRAVDAITTSYSEQKKQLDDIQKQYDKMYGSGSEYDDLLSRIDTLTFKEKERLAILEAEAAALHQQVLDQQKLTFFEWRKKRENEGTTTTMSGGSQYAFHIVTSDANAAQVEKTKTALSELVDLYEAGNYTADGYKEKLQQLTLSLKDNAEAIQSGKDAGEKLTDSEQELLDLYNMMVGMLSRMVGEKNTDTQATNANAAATDRLAKANETLKTAFEEVESKSSLTYGTLEDLEALYPGLSAKIIDANGNLTKEGQAALSTKQAFLELLGQMTVFNNSSLDVAGKIEQLRALAEMAGITGAAISMIGSDTSNLYDIYGMYGITGEAASQEILKLNYKRWLDAIHDTKYVDTPKTGGGGGGGSSADAELTVLQSIVSLRKQELSFIQESGGSIADQVAKMREIQEALHAQAEYMRSINGETADTIALSTEWWKIEKQIAELQNKEILDGLKENVALLESELNLMEAQGASYEDQIRKIREIQTAIDSQIVEMRRQGASQREINELLLKREKLDQSILDIQKKQREEVIKQIEAQMKQLEDEKNAKVKALKDQIEALKRQREEQNEITTLAEKELAVREAMDALDRARRERTVRQYNAASNQWEWVADAKAVEQAEKALEDAQKALDDYRDDVEFEGKIKAIEDQIEAVETEYQTLSDALQKMIDELNNAADNVKKINEKYKKVLDGIEDLNLRKKLEAIFGDDSLTDDTKDLIAETITKMLGVDQDKTAAEIFTAYIQQALKTNDPNKAIKSLVDALNSGAVKLGDVDSILENIGTDYGKILAITQMRLNSIAWWSSDDARKAQLHAENMRIGQALGWTYDGSTGQWYDEKGNVAYTIEGGGAGSTGGTGGGTGGETGGGTGGTGGDTGTSPRPWETNPISPLTPDEQTQQAGYQAALERVRKMTADEYSSTPNAGSLGPYYGDGFNDGSDWVTMAWTSEGPMALGIGKGTGAGRIITRIRNGELERGQTYTGSDGMHTYTISGLSDGGVTATRGGQGAKFTEILRFYDRGGILHGYGGIKATAGDEMVLPPSMTARMINAEATGAFDALLRHLGIVTAAATSYAGFGGGLTNNSIGEQHNGDVFYIDGVSIPGISTSTTLGDLARCAKNLALVKGS